jgi:hypothetical protein
MEAPLQTKWNPTKLVFVAPLFGSLTRCLLSRSRRPCADNFLSERDQRNLMRMQYAHTQHQIEQGSRSSSMFESPARNKSRGVMVRFDRWHERVS